MDEVLEQYYDIIPEFNSAGRLCNYHTGGEGETARVMADEWERFNQLAGRQHEIVDGLVVYNPDLEPCMPDADPPDPLTELQYQVQAQAVIAAMSIGAEVELTPEVVELATAAADIVTLPDDEPWRPGVRVEAGTTVTYDDGLTYECRQRHVTQADWTPDKTPALWVVKQAEPEPGVVLPWVAGEDVKKGDLREFNSKTYECIQPHTTQAGWTPPAVPALWREVA